ncbi:protein FAM57A-like isoform X2 [Gouania willdenowi]|uniref:protein FAM57A-like isoform X2 n=1 Tax=Gouania willdenowi TaxID=441366 RepID=UPI001055AB5C|nr:protein FAM57A-like isoform X2 [Gouania willdenowi]
MLSAVLAGAVAFPLLFCCVRQTLKSSVTGWSDADSACVSERVVSAFHASLATAAGVLVVTSCKDVMIDSHWLVNGFVLFGAPYMAFDIYAMYLSHFYSQGGAHKGHSLKSLRAFLLKDWMLVLHHTVLLLVFMPITLFFRKGLGDFFIGCLFITEFSTPFISIGKILIQFPLLSAGPREHQAVQGQWHRCAADFLHMSGPTLPLHVLEVRTAVRDSCAQSSISSATAMQCW